MVSLSRPAVAGLRGLRCPEALEGRLLAPRVRKAGPAASRRFHPWREAARMVVPIVPVPSFGALIVLPQESTPHKYTTFTRTRISRSTTKLAFLKLGRFIGPTEV